MRNRTFWRKSNTEIVGERLFNDEFGFFRIKKIQSCLEYCKSAVNLDGTNWFEKRRAFVVTESGLKYTVPFLSLYMKSTYANGKSLVK